MVALVNARSIMLAASPSRYTVVLPQRYIYPSMDNNTWSDTVPIVVVTDGKVGPSVRRSPVGAGNVALSNNAKFQIDRTRTYRSRFWARASAAANGVLYFALQQFLADDSTGSTNSGLSPYKPSNISAASAQPWTEFTNTWTAADWQAGVTQVAPYFWLNYGGSAGYWEVQDFEMQDVTEMVAAQAAATYATEQAALANAALTIIFDDNKLSKGEKSEVILKVAVMDGEYNDIIAKAAAAGVSSTSYSSSKTALNTLLYTDNPTWNNTAVDTTINGATFRAAFKLYYDSKTLLLNAIAAKAATTATGLAVSGNIILSNTLPTSLAGFTGASSSGAYTWEIVYDADPYWAGGGVGGVVFTHVLNNATPPVGTWIDCYKDGDTKHPVVAGRRYEFGINISSHRCSGVAVLMWYNAAGTYITETVGNYIDQSGANAVSHPVDFPRSFGFVIAPAGAALAFLKGMQHHNGAQANPYVFYSKWYFGEAGADQTVPSKWSESQRVLSQVAANAQAAATAATAQAALANAALDKISSDGFLTAGEKPEVVKEWLIAQSEVSNLYGQGGTYNVLTERNAYSAKYDALETYLATLTGWNVIPGTDVAITGSVFRSKFAEYYTARTTLLLAIAAKTSTMASGLVLSSTGALTGPGGAVQGQMTALPTVDLGDGTHFGARNKNDAPSEYPWGTSKQFKAATAVGLADGGGVNYYITLETTKQYIDNGGGGVYQYAMQGAKTWRRFSPQAAGNTSTFLGWVQDLDRNAYTGDLNASNDISLVITGAGTTAYGNTVTRQGQVGWDGAAFTPQGFAGGASVSFEPVVGGDWMAGLDSNPAQDSSYVNIDYAFYGTGTALYFYESGDPITTVNYGYATGDVLSVTYDGTNVTYMKNKDVLRVVPAAVTGPLGFDSSLIAGTLRNIRLIPLSNSYNAAGKGGALNSDPACAQPSQWLFVAGSVSFLTEGAGAGNTFMRSSTTANISAGNSKPFALVAGRTYRMSCFIRSPSGVAKNFYLRVNRKNSSGGLIAYYSGYEAAITASATFTEMAYQFTAEAGTIYGEFEYDLHWNPSSNGSALDMKNFRIDDVTEAAAAKAVADAALIAANSANTAINTPFYITQVADASFSLSRSNSWYGAGSYAANVVGGTGPFTYSWSLPNSAGNQVGIRISGASNGSGVSLEIQCNIAGASADFEVRCMAIDSKNRSTSMSFNLSADFT